MKQVEQLQKYHDEGNKVQISNGMIQVIDQEGYLVEIPLRKLRKLIKEVMFLFRTDHRIYRCTEAKIKNNNVLSGSKGFELALGVNLVFESYKEDRIITAFYNLKNDDVEARKKQMHSIRVIDEDYLSNHMDELVQEKLMNDANTIGEKLDTAGWYCPKRGILTKLIKYVHPEGVEFPESAFAD